MSSAEVQLDLNQDHIRRLVEQLQSGPSVVPFAGAGLSVPFGLPSWKSFLLQLAKEAGEDDAVGRLLGDGEYEEAAEMLRGLLTPLAFDDALESAFGNHAIVQPDSVAAVTLLPRITRGAVITTNFDRVLERTFTDAGHAFEQVVWGATPDSVVRALQRDSHILLKIHGDVADTQNRVLTRTEYKALYGDLLAGKEVIKPLSSLLRRLLESRTILFVGCSLQTDRIVTMLLHAAGRTAAFTHYALVPEPAAVEDKRARARFLAERRIRPIWYPTGRHDFIVPLLQELLARIAAPDRSPLTPLVPAEEFFQPFLQPAPDRLFHHDWEMVGRTDMLALLHDWVETGERPIALLTGRGGIGKSKLLHAFYAGFPQHHGASSLRFALQEIPFGIDSLSLTSGKNVLVVDDAHRREDIGLLLEFARRHPARIKVLLVSRPHRVESLRLRIGQARFDVRDVTELGELGQLNHDETRDLARQVLGEEYSGYTDRLVELTRDSPLITVLGGQLLVERAVSPNLLERNDEFRQVLLDRFRDEVTGRISDEIDPGFISKVLKLIAVSSPIRLEDGSFLQVSASFLQSSEGEVLAAVDALDTAGVLLRRGQTLRITPDVLGDHVLHRACITSSGMQTGFAQEAFDLFRSSFAAQVLANLSELDWRIRVASGDETALLDDIWASLEMELREANRWHRRELLTILIEVAYSQPERTLHMVEFAMQNPALPTPGLPDRWPWNVDPSEQDVLPRLLHRIAYTPEYLPRCCDLLWELGRDDERSTNAHPYHGMRVLADLAAYEDDKRLGVNGTVLEAAARWLATPDAHTHRHSPLDAIDPLLAKVGSTDFADGPRWGMRSFHVDPDSTGPLRAKARELILGCLPVREVKVIVRVLDSLFEALREPIPLYGLDITPDDLAKWQSERLNALDAIKRVMTEALDPLVHLRVAGSLPWHTRQDRDAVVAIRAKQVMDAIPRTLDLQLLASLSHQWDIWPAADGSYQPQGLEQRQAKNAAAVESLASDFRAVYTHPSGAATAIESALLRLDEVGIRPAPARFFEELAKQDIELVAGIAGAGANQPTSLLAQQLGTLLWHLRDVDQVRATDFAVRVLDQAGPVACRAISHWGRICARDPQPQDIAILERLVEHPDSVVRGNAVESLDLLARADPQLSARLVLQVDFGADSAIAAAVCAILEAVDTVDSTVLRSEDIVNILDALRSVRSLDEHYIGEFLAIASRHHLPTVVSMLLSRIVDHMSTSRTDIDPLPSHDLDKVFAAAPEDPAFADVLRSIRKHVLGDDWRIEFWVPKLFASASCGFSPIALKVVDEWARDNDAQKVRAASRLLREVPPMFVFEHREFARDLLEHAHALGIDVYADVAANLSVPVRSEGRQRTLGIEDVFPQDVAQADRTAEAMENFSAGSPAYRFYADLKSAAEASMRWQRLRDEEEFG